MTVFPARRSESPPVILVAHRSTEDLAIAALRLGMVDYFRLRPTLEDPA